MAHHRTVIAETISEDEMLDLSKVTPAASIPAARQRRLHSAGADAKKLQKELQHELSYKEERQKEDLDYFTLLSFLFRWHYSAYSLIWSDVLIWGLLYTSLNLLYRFCMDDYYRVAFIKLVLSVNTWQSSLPVTFLLGFFVSNVVSRWWRAFTVLIIAVYTWYFTEAISAQMIDIKDLTRSRDNATEGPPEAKFVKMAARYLIDYYLPLLSLLKVVFIMGWFKVAMVVMDPFGTDKEDLPISQVLTDNLHKGRRFSELQPQLLPKKLQLGSVDCFNSDDEETKQMVRQRRGPWRESSITTTAESAVAARTQL